MQAKTKKIIVFGLGAFLFVFGLVLGGCWFLLFSTILKSKLVLSPTSTSYDMWIETPIPMYMEFYLFNWTNAYMYDLNFPVANRTKPEFKELGPYVFSEHNKRVNLTWNSNDTVTFQQTRQYVFRPELSSGSIDDKVTTVNVIAVAAAYFSRYDNIYFKIIMDGFLEKLESISTTHTVGEMLFDGYDDKLIDLATELHIQKFKLPFKKFAWFAERNNSASYDGWFNMHTGAGDVRNLGNLYAWNYAPRTPYYKSTCGLVRGSTGELMPPVDGLDEIFVFSPDLCTSLSLVSQGDYETKGVVGTRFSADLRNLDNGTYFPEKSCYTSGTPVPAGALNISLCKWNAPAFVSYPHFYLADESYRGAVAGMRPNKSLHEFFLAVEPKTGIPLAVRARMQLNILLQPYQDMKMFKDLPRVFIPTLWFTQKADIDDSLASTAKLVLSAPVIGWGTLFGLSAVGLLILVVGLVVTVRHGWDRDDTRELISKRRNKNSSPTPPPET
ncbi:protein croquemort-like [Bacillus rossius redtenbacheri]|uniref:protein croquemort-like n=1 Tax=Bacillus rossius redtenbacheri TaxID=93214 RepID=UPI002FDDC085